MCGILGYIALKESELPSEPLFNKALHLLAHRGPDDLGVWYDTSLVLGHRRLSIIDLTPSGHQPMCDESGRYWIVFNGEIYNYIELKSELMNKGYKFRSTSDTEVLLNSYIEWGELCVEKFNGMWAFAIWDKKSKKLFASRDRFGKKPFYYYIDNERIIFASEIKAFRPFMGKLSVNRRQLYRFLSSNLYLDQSETLFDNINMLLPSHNLVVSNGKMQFKRYYDLYDEDAGTLGDFASASDEFKEILIDAVKIRLRSDVPLGLALSGGLDSAAIGAIMSLSEQEKVHCFTTTYADKSYSEEVYAKAVVDKYNYIWHPILTDINDFTSTSSKLVYHLDTPSRNFPAFLYWKLMQHVKDYLKVSLNGQGADEILAGHILHKCMYIDYLLGGILINPVGNLHQMRSILSQNPIPQLVKFWTRYKFPKIQKYYRKISGLGSTIHPALQEEAKGVIPYEVNPKNNSKIDIFAKRMYYDLFYRTLPSLLHYDDRVTMAHSIESRVPFLDYRLVNFSWRVAPPLKFQGNTTKYILRQSLEQELPREIYLRRDKQGYISPISKWFQTKHVKDEIFSAVTDSIVQNERVFNAQSLTELYKNRHTFDVSSNLWSMFTTALWLGQR